MRIAVYLRVSTGEQSTDSQRQAILPYIERRYPGATVSVYEDIGYSGTKAVRPELTRLLKDARAGRLDSIVCFKLDRLFRSARDMLNTLQELQERHIEFVSVQDGVDLGTAQGRLMAQLLSAMAEFEAALIRERVRAGIAAAKAKGKHCGRPNKQAHIAHKAKAMRADGMPIRAIATALGVSPATVSRALG